jgi:hypothetical protein
MERRNSLVLILLAALLGSAALAPRSSGLPDAAPTAEPTQSKTAGAEPSPPLTRARNANAIVKEFISGRIKLKSVTAANDDYAVVAEVLSDGGLMLSEDKAADYRGWTVESLIVLVPDPVESGLGSVFDEYVDSIERAVSANGYDLDHFYNPWPSPEQLAKTASGDGSDGQAGASNENETDSQRVPIYEIDPGLILFRNDCEHQLLVAFLVGETPTTGIHKGAFESALKQASELPKSDPIASCPNGPDCESPIRVMGPSFSGSATSMVLAIEEWASGLKGAPGIKIISGAATAIDPGIFEDLNVTYQTTIIPNSTQMEALLSWLDGGRVAVLSEEGTSFGRNVRLKTDSKTDSNILYLQFPLHVAELQRAAERKMQTAKTGAATTPSLSNPNLPLDTHESHTRRDLLPLYSTAETNRQELVLDANMRAINEHEISYVIVAATDPADILFLVHWIRQNCPNVTPVVLDADLLYLHTDVNPETRGMVVASTYPLYLENQLWSGNSAPIQFSLNSSEGIYNATLALLGDPSKMLDYAMPFASDSSNPARGDPQTHPLWISMVGADQIWPVSIRDARVPTGYMVSTEPMPGAPTDTDLRIYSRPFLLTSALIALGCMLLWGFIAANDSENLARGVAPVSWVQSITPVWIQQTLGDAVLTEYKPVRRRQLLLLSVVLFCLLATVAGYFFLPPFTPLLLRGFDLSKVLAALLVIVAALGAGLASIATPSWFESRWARIIAPALLLVVILVAMVGVYEDPVSRLFLFLRTSDLDSKVSPLVPMLLTYAAAITLIFGALRRHAVMESRQILVPMLDFGTDSFSGVADLERNVRDCVGTGNWAWRAHCQIALPIVLTYALALPFRQFFKSHVDTIVFKWWFSIVSVAVYVGIGLALVRMIAIWRSVRTLLRRLYTHPSRYGYAGYRAALHISPEATGDLFSKVPAMSQIEVALAQVRELINSGDATSTSSVPEVMACLKSQRPRLRFVLPCIERCIDSALRVEAKGDWRRQIERMQDAENWMACLSLAIAKIFEPLWRGVSTGRDSQHSKPPEGAKSIDEIGEIYVASRVVDFLRHVMPQLETLATTTTLAMLLMLFAVSSYPFPARDDLLWFSWLVVVATAGSIMWMFFSLNRDRVASLIAGTTPGQTDWNSALVLQVATHALIPILVLLGAAFPARLGALATWIGSLFGGHS